MKVLKPFLLITDLGFVIYWVLTIVHLIPAEYLFKDYNNPISVAWNWSFLPLDLAISATGFLTLLFYRLQREKWKKFCLITLVLTFCSGLQAISFWMIKADFDLMWWIPNLFLLIYPIPFISKMIVNK